MPNLPTIPLTDAQADRCLAAWGTVPAYKEWLTDAVRAFVVEAERVAALRPFLDAQAAASALATDPLTYVAPPVEPLP